jgi:3-methyladenine DNA glycosylase AlkD
MDDEVSAIREELRTAAEPERVPDLLRFFKTGPGQYGEGDVFIGVRLGGCRRIVNAHRELPLSAALELLDSDVHEERLVALLIMVQRHRRHPEEREELYDAYLAHTARVDNWDLVDATAPYLVGGFLRDRPRDRLYELARSDSLWERRIAIIATLAFIRGDDLDDTFAICEQLLGDREDLIHKACGWALREAGKRDERRMIAFLERHVGRMPRTTFRYAIERLEPVERARLMALPRKPA